MRRASILLYLCVILALCVVSSQSKWVEHPAAERRASTLRECERDEIDKKKCPAPGKEMAKLSKTYLIAIFVVLVCCCPCIVCCTPCLSLIGLLLFGNAGALAYYVWAYDVVFLFDRGGSIPSR